MGMDGNLNFDLHSIFKLTSLDVRLVIKASPALRVDEYFKLLSRFLRDTPPAIESLKIISSQNGGTSEYKILSKMKTLLEDIGCTKFSSAFNDILTAEKRGHHKFASLHTEEISGDLTKLQSQISAAAVKKNPEPVDSSSSEQDAFDQDPSEQNSSEKDQVIYGYQSLKKVLQLFEEENAKRKLRILAIDDAPVILQTITSLLGNEYKVYSLSNPVMLEKFLQQITPDLFLLDYKMPGRSGFDLIPIIRNFDEHKDTPIIFLTSLGTPDHVAAALALGAVDFIVKPFQENILREKITKHIVRKKIY